MSLNDLYLCKVIGRLAGQVTINTFHYKETIEVQVGDNAATLAAALDQFGAMPSFFRGCCSSDWIEEGLSAQRIRPLPRGDAFIIAHSLPGTRALGACPPQISAVITERTGIAGRANRGRIYVPAVPEQDQADGLLNTSYMATLTALAGKLDDIILSGTGSFNPVVHSLRLNGVPRDVAIPIIATVARNICYTQRRRTVGRGV